MKFRIVCAALISSGLLTIGSAHADTTLTELKNLTPGGGLSLYRSPPIWGKDGRLYYYGMTRIVSILPDGSDMQTSPLEEGQTNSIVLYQSTPNMVQNSQGSFFAGTTEPYLEEDGVAKLNCPSKHYSGSAAEGNYQEWINYGALYKYAPGEAPQVITPPMAICPNDLIQIDSDDAIYFSSKIEDNGGIGGETENIGFKIYQYLESTNTFNELIDLATAFNTFVDNLLPAGMLAADDGYLYGQTRFSSPINEKDGALWRIKTDGTGELEILKDFVASEDGGVVFIKSPSSGKPSDYPWLEQKDNAIYGYTSEILYKFDIGTKAFTKLHKFENPYEEPQNSAPIGQIAFGGDDHLYITSLKGGNIWRGTISRFNLTTSEYTTLHEMTQEGDKPKGIMAGRDGKLYGSYGSTGIMWALDIGYTPTSPVINSFSSDSSEVEWIGSAQSNVTLNWNVSNADTCEASGAWSGSKDTIGAEVVTPEQLGDNIYTLTCDNGSGLEDATSSESVTVKAVEPPAEVSIISFIISETTLIQGDTTTLDWQVENAVACGASGNWSGNKDISGGSEEITPNIGTSAYTLTCTGLGGDSQSESIEVTVEEKVNQVDSSSSSGGAFNPLLLLPAALLLFRRRRAMAS